MNTNKEKLYYQKLKENSGITHRQYTQKRV